MHWSPLSEHQSPKWLHYFFVNKVFLLLPHLALIGSSLRGCWSSAVPADEGSCPGPAPLPTPDLSLPILLLPQVALHGVPPAEAGVSLCRVRALKVHPALCCTLPHPAIPSEGSPLLEPSHHTTFPFREEYDVEMFIASTPSGVRRSGAPVCQYWSCVCAQRRDMFCKDKGSGVEAASVKLEAGRW